eukprot:58848_1
MCYMHTNFVMLVVTTHKRKAHTAITNTVIMQHHIETSNDLRRQNSIQLHKQYKQSHKRKNDTLHQSQTANICNLFGTFITHESVTDIAFMLMYVLCNGHPNPRALIP